jgi:FAD/FMN-containing dehydrogenase
MALARSSSVSVSRFKERFAGETIESGEAGYDQARAVWNGIADRRPALVVRPTSVDDVIVAIQLAREQEAAVAVRGGGHSVAGFSTCDGGVVIDLSRMREVRVDPARRRATVQGGAHLSQLDQAAQAHGMVCPVGVVGHTGVAGLTLGGGMGRLQRKHGLTVDNLVSVDLVTADGRRLHASDEENPDLFWGLRGAGPNFGIATSFEFRLHPLDKTVFHGVAVFPIDRTLGVTERVREFIAAHDDVHVALAFTVEEDRPVLVVGSMHTGDMEQAERDARMLRQLKPLSDTYGRKSYLAVQGMADESMGWGQRFYTKSGFLTELTDEVVSVCAAQAETLPPGAEISLWAQDGAVGRVSDDAMAYTGRDAPFNISAELVWTDPADDDGRIAWGRAMIAKVKPFMTTGQYVNDVVEAGTPGEQIYGKAKYERLVGLKRKYDPDNFFHLNQNIKP